MKRSISLVVLAAALAGCTAPPVEEEGGEVFKDVPANRTTAPARDAAAHGLGDLGGSVVAATPPRPEPLPDVAADKADLLAAAWKEGKERFEARDYEGAAETFAEVYEYSRRSRRAEEALFLLGESRFLAGDYARALQSYERLLKSFPSTERYPTALERIFQIGKVFCDQKAKKPSLLLGLPMSDVDFGIEVLDRFAKQRDRHPLAPEALFVIGETHLREGEGELAIEVWQRLVKAYPQSRWAPLAEYHTALAFLSLSAGVEYDKRPILTGLKRLRAYVRKYPTGDKSAEASAKLKALEEELATHELTVARSYARTDHWASARIYLDAVIRDYPKTGAAQEAQKLSQTWPQPPAETAK